jgi:Sulfotransferase family
VDGMRDDQSVPAGPPRPAVPAGRGGTGPTDHAAPVTVLYFMGWCRTGTTVLGNVLGEIDGVFHAGELHFLWRNGVLSTGTNRRCGCGAPLARCPVWSRVLPASVEEGETLAAHAARVEAWQQARFRTRHTFRLLRALGPDRERALRSDPAVRGYLRTLAATYRAIADATGARVVVDTSKFASEAAALDAVEGVVPVLVHQVRDPRATAYSWDRPKDYIPRRGKVNSTWYWVGFDLAADAVRRRWPERSVLVRYEDFVLDPSATVARILPLIGVPASANPVAADGSVTLGPNHTVTGNPDRFLTGRTVLREDARWRAEMPRSHRALVTAMTLPFLSRYGYSPAGRVRPRAAAPRRSGPWSQTGTHST